MLFVRRALRARWWGGLALAIGIGATAVATVTARRWYRSESVIAYSADVRLDAVVSGADIESPRQVTTRLQDMMSSRQRLQKTIDVLGLYPNIVREHGSVQAVDEMRKHLKFSAGDGFTYHLTFESESRELAQKVLATFVDDFIEEDRSARRREVETTKTFLDNEKKEAVQDLTTREAALSAFLVQHPELASESASTASVGGVSRAENRERKSANPMALLALESQAQQIEETLATVTAAPPAPAAGPSPAAEEAALIRSQAEAALTAARRDLADKAAAFTDQHPDVKEAQRRVFQAESDLSRADAAMSALPAAPPEAAAVEDDPIRSARAASLRRLLVLVRAQIADLSARTTPRPLPRKPTARPGSADQDAVAVDTEWTRLSREVSEARERQNQLENRQLQTDLLAALVSTGSAGRLMVVDPAFRPIRPVAGRHRTIALVGGVGSLVLALLVMMALAFLDQRLYWTGDVQRAIGDQFVIWVPALPINRHERLPLHGVQRAR